MYLPATQPPHLLDSDRAPAAARKLGRVYRHNPYQATPTTGPTTPRTASVPSTPGHTTTTPTSPSRNGAPLLRGDLGANVATYKFAPLPPPAAPLLKPHSRLPTQRPITSWQPPPLVGYTATRRLEPRQAAHRRGGATSDPPNDDSDDAAYKPPQDVSPPPPPPLGTVVTTYVDADVAALIATVHVLFGNAQWSAAPPAEDDYSACLSTVHSVPCLRLMQGTKAALPAAFRRVVGGMFNHCFHTFLWSCCALGSLVYTEAEALRLAPITLVNERRVFPMGRGESDEAFRRRVFTADAMQLRPAWIRCRDEAFQAALNCFVDVCCRPHSDHRSAALRVWRAVAYSAENLSVQPARDLVTAVSQSLKDRGFDRVVQRRRIHLMARSAIGLLASAGAACVEHALRLRLVYDESQLRTFLAECASASEVVSA